MKFMAVLEMVMAILMPVFNGNTLTVPAKLLILLLVTIIVLSSNLKEK